MISDSTSSGAAARQAVLTPIRGRSISGIIWMGKRPRLMPPKMSARMTPTVTATGLERAIRVNGLTGRGSYGQASEGRRRLRLDGDFLGAQRTVIQAQAGDPSSHLKVVGHLAAVLSHVQFAGRR
jgi:hypothetical protein